MISTEKERVAMGDELEQQQSEIVTLPVEWHFAEGLQSRYANNALVQTGQHEFVISFFEIQPPLLVGSPEENKAKLQQMGAIQAECVSKVILSPEVIPGLISALQAELEKYQSQKSNS